MKIIDAEALPAFLGGKKTDPDGNPLCLTFVSTLQPVIFRRYFFKYTLYSRTWIHFLIYIIVFFFKRFLLIFQLLLKLKKDYPNENGTTVAVANGLMILL